MSLRGFLDGGANETLPSPLESSPEEGEESPEEDEESPEEDEESPEEEEPEEESAVESLSDDDDDSGIIFVTSFLSFLSLSIRLAVYHIKLTTSRKSLVETAHKS